MHGNNLTQIFSQRIGILWTDGRVLWRRKGVRESVASRRSGIEEALYACPHGFLHRVKGAVYISAEVRIGAFDGGNDVGECRQMKDALRALKQALACLAVA